MTAIVALADRPYPRADAATAVELPGWSRVGGWALDGLTVLAVGLAVPLAVLAIGLPIVFVLRLAAALVSQF